MMGSLQISELRRSAISGKMVGVPKRNYEFGSSANRRQSNSLFAATKPWFFLYPILVLCILGTQNKFYAVSAFTTFAQEKGIRSFSDANRILARNMVPQIVPADPETTEALSNLRRMENEYLGSLGPKFKRTSSDAISVTQTAMNSNRDEDCEDTSTKKSPSGESTTSSSSSVDDDPETQYSEDEKSLQGTDAETIIDRQAALSRAGILKNTKASKRSTGKKTTSIGERRTGSATQARRGVRRTTQLVDAVRQRAQGIAGSKSSQNSGDVNGTRPKRDEGSKRTQARLATSKIQSTVEEILQKQKSYVNRSQSDRFTAAISNWGRTIGILGEEGGSPTTQILHESSSLVVRVATPIDDVDIANLRLSVFSDFSPEMRSQFCFRSCQALAHRRTNGALCVVATPAPDKVRPVVLGSAECSHHEFQNTRLGRRRPKGSLLYITEVAVHPSARRRGIGAKLLEAMDAIADDLDAETLFLHVDVSNENAVSLYKKCGYLVADERDPIFQEFTTSLNLHPGATRGRTHHLLYKNIKVPTWVEERGCQDRRVTGQLGFEIPA